MRRIYESDALHRDDDPHTPSKSGGDGPGTGITANQHGSMVDWSRASHALLPTWVRDRAIDVSVATDRDSYERDEPVGIRVRLANRLPFPVAIRTPTRRYWDWAVAGERRGEGESIEDPPAEPSLLEFHRSETKTVTRTWHQRFRTAPDRWSRADAGTYAVSAFVDVAAPAARGLQAATEIEIRD